MKKIKLILLIAISIILIPYEVNAATASISVSSSSTIALGNTVTVTVKLSSSTKIGSWEMLLNYDSSYLKLTSATSEEKGVKMASVSPTGVTSKTYTFKFKTLKTGSTKISVPSYLAYEFEGLTKMTVSSGSKTITIKTQADIEASYSKDNDLKAFSVEGYTLNQEFNKDTLEYSVDVPEGTEKVNIIATKNHSQATVSGSGEVEVSPGANVFEILVRAQNGSEQIYKLTVNVIDQNPINVKVDNVNYTVVKLRESLTMPVTFTETTVTINEFEIPAFYNEKLKYTLVGLKDESGNISLHIYDQEKKSYELYNEILFNGISLLVSEPKGEIPNGYTKYTETILENELTVYKISKDSRTALIYGTNVLTGEEGYYIIDTKDNSITIYDDEYIVALEEKNELFMYIILGFSGILFILFIIIIKLLSSKKNSKKKKRVKADEINY